MPGWALKVPETLQIMQPKNTTGTAVQWELERSGVILEKIVRPQHPVGRLARALDWQRFD